MSLTAAISKSPRFPVPAAAGSAVAIRAYLESGAETVGIIHLGETGTLAEAIVVSVAGIVSRRRILGSRSQHVVSLADHRSRRPQVRRVITRAQREASDLLLAATAAEAGQDDDRRAFEAMLAPGVAEMLRLADSE